MIGNIFRPGLRGRPLEGDNRDVDGNDGCMRKKILNYLDYFRWCPGFGRSALELPSNQAAGGKLKAEKLQVRAGGDVVLIYQMGKVGSSSIYAAFKEQQPRIPVYHIHYLSDNRLHEAVEWHLANKFAGLPEHVIVSQALRDFIGNNKDKVQWNIISLARDPVALQVAIIFQNLQEAFSSIIDADGGGVDQQKAQNLVEQLLEEHKIRDNHFVYWFDYEIKEVFGIDIYKHEFDQQRGYTVISEGNVNILLMQFEKINDCFADGVQNMLKIKNMHLPHLNVGSAKPFGLDYNMLKSSIKLSSRLCDEIYATKLCRYFYSNEQLEQFKKKWSSAGSR